MILIGQDNWPVIVTRKIVHGLWNGPTISKTLLGWVVHGNVSSNLNSQYHSTFHVTDLQSFNDVKDDIDILQDLIKEQWNYDISGTKNLEIDSCLSENDKRCLKILDDTIKRVGNRYESGLLWKH
ncbi:MAG TPA: hypothetical protein DDZ41_05770, partial [Flavobacterium sp.]|nr:hypothetical protein [Flavobacterium sp.]